MCGRFTRVASVEAMADLFQLIEVPEFPQQYNIAPTQPVAAVRVNPERGQRELVALRWGLVPSWADDPKIGNRLINARADTAAVKPAFRSAFRARRCLIAADGFYEWRQAKGGKQPYYVRMKDGRPFAFAGLWERWQKAPGPVVETCTILTTEANELARPIHDRMPVILSPADFERWLDPHVQEPEMVQPLLRPYPADEMTAYPVSRWVNDPRHDGPRCAALLQGRQQERVEDEHGAASIRAHRA